MIARISNINNLVLISLSEYAPSPSLAFDNSDSDINTNTGRDDDVDEAAQAAKRKKLLKKRKIDRTGDSDEVLRQPNQVMITPSADVD